VGVDIVDGARRDKGDHAIVFEVIERCSSHEVGADHVHFENVEPALGFDLGQGLHEACSGDVHDQVDPAEVCRSCVEERTHLIRISGVRGDDVTTTMFDDEFGEFVWPSGREHDLGPRCNGRTGDGGSDAGRRAHHNDPSAGCIGARGGYASWVHGYG